MLDEKRKYQYEFKNSSNHRQENKEWLDTIISNTPTVIYTYKIDNIGNL